MSRIAILGGGIAGLTAAYELEQHRLAGKPVDWHLFEASPRLGGLVSTTRMQTPEGEYVLEDGPDGWLTEKPAARLLAEELGLAGDLLPCNENDKRTYIRLQGRFIAMPARMRLMVPEDLSTLVGSPLFTPEAQDAYAAELNNSEKLKATAPKHDESVASFTRRHFGHEVLTKVAAPLLAGVFGGDVETLSVHAVMPQFVAMEREHGSLIAALQHKARTRPAQSTSQPTFTSLRRGMGSLTEALIAHLPPERLHTNTTATTLRRTPQSWLVRFAGPDAHTCAIGFVPYDHVVLALPPDATRALLNPVDPTAAALLPTDASSALLVTLCWPAALAQALTLPPGFGFLVPPAQGPEAHSGPQLLAATFAHQKYPHRAPAGAKVIRTFFGNQGAQTLAHADSSTVAQAALTELRTLLGPLSAPDPTLTTVRRWPRSLPQYAVGHLDRIAQLGHRTRELGGIHLLGNGYHGVGVPDLIRHARAAARNLAESLT